MRVSLQIRNSRTSVKFTQEYSLDPNSNPEKHVLRHQYAWLVWLATDGSRIMLVLDSSVLKLFSHQNLEILWNAILLENNVLIFQNQMK